MEDMERTVHGPSASIDLVSMLVAHASGWSKERVSGCLACRSRVWTAASRMDTRGYVCQKVMEVIAIIATVGIERTTEDVSTCYYEPSN